MKKTIWSIALVCVFFCSCAAPIVTDTENIAVANRQTASGAAPASECFSLQNPAMTTVTTAEGLQSAIYASNEKGCYEYQMHEDFTATLIYTDYETCQRNYVAARAIENTHGGIALFLTEDNLYALQLGSPRLYDYYGEIGLPRISKMNPDGTESEDVIRFERDEDIMLNSQISYDGTHLYYLVDVYGGKQYEKLLRVDVNTGQREELKVFDGLTYYMIAGAYRGSLVLVGTRKPESNTTMSPEMEYEKTIVCMSLYNPSTGYLGDVTEWALPEYGGGRFHDGSHYFWNEKEQVLKRFDIDTMQTSVAASGFKENYGNDVTAAVISDVYDNHLFLRIIADDLENTPIVSVDLDTGKTVPLTLRGTKNPVGIYGASENRYFVNTGVKDVPFTGTGPDGIPYEATMPVLEFCMIDKDDYWANNPNYIPILDNVDG